MSTSTESSIFANQKACVTYNGETVVCDANKWQDAVDALLLRHGPWYGEPAVELFEEPLPPMALPALYDSDDDDSDARALLSAIVVEDAATAALKPLSGPAVMQANGTESFEPGTVPAAPKSKPVVTDGKIKRDSRGRVRSIMRPVDEQDLAWDPELAEQFTLPLDESDIEEDMGAADLPEGADDLGLVRSGTAYAIVRRGFRSDPLGFVKDNYVSVSHRTTIANIKGTCGDVVEQDGPAWMDGIGAHLAHHFSINHINASIVNGVRIEAVLTVVHDNTGAGAVGTFLQIRVDGQLVGTVMTEKGLHVGSQPERWQQTVAAFVERAILAQDALGDIVAALHAMPMTDDLRLTFEKKDMKIQDKGQSVTLLDAVRQWHSPTAGDLTWLRWTRSLEDRMLREVCRILPAYFGRSLDAALGHRHVEGGEYFGRFGRLDPVAVAA